jgi:hypothetical protein
LSARRSLTMAHICLVACAGVKHQTTSAAQDLYHSALFTKSRRFAEREADAWFVLSAKYGLLDRHQVIAPYEETLNRKSKLEREAWAGQVWASLSRVVSSGDRVTFLAGKRYREQLMLDLQRAGCHVEVPLSGLSIGQQLQWLNHREGTRDC